MQAIGDVLKEMAERRRLAGPLNGGSGTLVVDSGPQPDPNCPRCGGKGRVEYPPTFKVRRLQRNPATRRDEPVDVAYVECRNCSCIAQTTATVRSAESVGLGGRLEPCTLADFDPSELSAADWQAVHAWTAALPESLSDGGAGWLFSGNNGTGKTHLAAAMLHLVRLLSIRVRFIEETALIREVQATYHPDSDESESVVIDRLIAVPLLCIDDMGQGYVPGKANAQDGATWLSSRIYALLNGRIVACRPTIVTTNLKKSALPSRLGDAAASRLDALRFVRFSGSDRR